MGWDHADRDWRGGSWEWVPHEGEDWRGAGKGGWQPDHEGDPRGRDWKVGKGKGGKRHEPYSKGGKGIKQEVSGKSKINEAGTSSNSGEPSAPALSKAMPMATEERTRLSWFGCSDRTDLRKTLCKARDTLNAVPKLATKQQLDEAMKKMDKMREVTNGQFLAIAKDASAARHASNRAEAQANANTQSMSALSDLVSGSDSQQMHNIQCIANFMWHFYQCMVQALNIPDSLSNHGPPPGPPAGSMASPQSPSLPQFLAPVSKAAPSDAKAKPPPQVHPKAAQTSQSACEAYAAGGNGATSSGDPSEGRG